MDLQSQRKTPKTVDIQSEEYTKQTHTGRNQTNKSDLGRQAQGLLPTFKCGLREETSFPGQVAIETYSHKLFGNNTGAEQSSHQPKASGNAVAAAADDANQDDGMLPAHESRVPF